MPNFLYKATTTLFGRDLSQEDQSVLFHGIRKSILVQAISYVLVFSSSVLFVRVGGVSNYGVYINIFNWLSVLALVACAGMEDIALSGIPVFLRKGQKGNVGQLIVLANKTVLVMSIVCAVIFGSLVFTGAVKGFQDNQYLLLGSLVNIYLLAFITLNQQVMQAFNRFYASQVTDKIIKPFLMVSFLLLCWLLQVKVDADWLVFGVTGIVFACAMIVFLLLRAPLAELLPQEKEKLPVKDIFHKSGFFLVISVLSFLKSKIGMLIIGSTGDTAIVGVLNIAFRISDFVLLPSLLIHMVIPQLFSAHLNSDPSYKRKLFRRCTYLLITGSLLIYLLIIIFGKPILRMYAAGLEDNYEILLILSGSQFLYSLFGPSVSFLMMQGGQKQAALALFLDISINCVLLFFLIQKNQANGVAWAALGGSLFYNILLRVLVERRLNSKT